MEAMRGSSVFLILLLCAQSAQSGEPVFREKAASEWARELSSSDSDVRGEAQWELEQGGSGAIPVLSYQRRLGGVLGHRARRAAFEVLVNLARHSEESMRLVSTDFSILDVKLVAARLGGRFVPHLITIISDDKRVWDGLLALKRIGRAAAGAVPAIVTVLSNNALRLTDRCEAAEALGAIKVRTPDVVAALYEAMSSDEKELAATSAASLWRLGVRSAMVKKRLLSALGSPSGMVQWPALLALNEPGSLAPEMRLPLLHVATEGKNWCRLEAAVCLIANGAEKDRALKILINALNDPASRRKAVQKVRRLGVSGRVAVPALRKVLNDPRASVRTDVAEALLGLGIRDDDVASVLKQGLTDTAWRVRRKCAELFGSMGAQGRSAVDKLKWMAREDPVGYVREAAAQAMEAVKAE
jgi:HEAT repeat protein